MYTITTLAELEQFAKRMAQELHNGGILALHGELGAGKTTFTQLLAKELGITDQLTSPTFTIMNIYDWGKNKKFYHLDLYRLKKVEEIEVLGLEEIFAEQNHIMVIEWPEIAETLLPENTLHLYFTLHEDGTRTISVQSVSDQ